MPRRWRWRCAARRWLRRAHQPRTRWYRACAERAAALLAHPARYLKKHNVRDWLRVVASNKDRSVYELRYFNIADAGEGEETD